MVAIRRTHEAYALVRDAPQAPQISKESVGQNAQKLKHLLDMKRTLRSSLLVAAYSMTETVLADCIGSSGKAVHIALPELSRASRIPILKKVEYNFRNRVGSAFDKEWESKWRELDELRLVRNEIAHEGGLRKSDSLKSTYHMIEADEISRFWLEPFFEGRPHGSKVIVVGEMAFSDRISKLQEFVMEVDKALFNADQS